MDTTLHPGVRVYVGVASFVLVESPPSGHMLRGLRSLLSADDSGDTDSAGATGHVAPAGSPFVDAAMNLPSASMAVDDVTVLQRQPHKIYMQASGGAVGASQTPPSAPGDTSRSQTRTYTEINTGIVGQPLVLALGAIVDQSLRKYISAVSNKWASQRTWQSCGVWFQWQ